MSNFPSYRHRVCATEILVAEKRAFINGVPVTEGQLIQLRNSINRAIDLVRLPLLREDCSHHWESRDAGLGVDVLCADCGQDATEEQRAEFLARKSDVTPG